MENLNCVNETEFHTPYILDSDRRPHYTFLGDCKKTGVRFPKEDTLFFLCEKYLSPEEIDLLKEDGINVCGGVRPSVGF